MIYAALLTFICCNYESIEEKEQAIRNTKVLEENGTTTELSAFEERVITSCKDGLIVDDSHCCWEGQKWSGNSCVGTPQCPEGWSGSGETCDPPTCKKEQIRIPDQNWGICCWEGQEISSSPSKCSGKPAGCPSGLKLTDFGCIDISKLSIETVSIPIETFLEGCTLGDLDCYDDENRHMTQLLRPFSMMKTEVTQSTYREVMGENPSTFKGDDRPVDSVRWHDAILFANRLSQIDNRDLCYVVNDEEVLWIDKNCNGWRLPTEAEWEHAARGGEMYKYSGSDNVEDVAWCDGQDGTHSVGLKKPNGYGLYDMSGNVWEWCWDWYGEFSSEIQIDPVGTESGIHHVFRGGSWSCYKEYVRVSHRGFDPMHRRGSIGIRLGHSP